MHEPTRAEFKRARATVLAAVIGKRAAKRLTKAERDEVLSDDFVELQSAIDCCQNAYLRKRR